MALITALNGANLSVCERGREKYKRIHHIIERQTYYVKIVVAHTYKTRNATENKTKNG